MLLQWSQPSPGPDFEKKLTQEDESSLAELLILLEKQLRKPYSVGPKTVPRFISHLLISHHQTPHSFIHPTIFHSNPSLVRVLPVSATLLFLDWTTADSSVVPDSSLSLTLLMLSIVKTLIA